MNQLLPEVLISGGSFAHLLPSPASLSDSKRLQLFNEIQRDSTFEVIQDLVPSTNCRISPPLERGKHGNRIWPTGYCGSITHKGTVVLGVLAEIDGVESIGIDLELNSKGGEGLEQTVDDDNTPPGINDSAGVLAGFSVKEAVYKAYYPITNKVITFDDVSMDWNNAPDSFDVGVANCPESVQISVRCASSGDWIISSATYPPKEDA